MVDRKIKRQRGAVPWELRGKNMIDLPPSLSLYGLKMESNTCYGFSALKSDKNLTYFVYISLIVKGVVSVEIQIQITLLKFPPRIALIATNIKLSRSRDLM